jgi:GNAT superfamily N-acetyltransferase
LQRWNCFSKSVLSTALTFLKLFRKLYPNQQTLEQLLEAVNSDIDSKKNNKSAGRGFKGPPAPAPAPAPPRVEEIQRVVAPPPIPLPISASQQQTSTHFPGTNDELTDTVVAVPSNLQRYKITPPTGYSFRLATPDDVDSILSLIKELAIYEQSIESFSMTKEVLLRDGWGIGRKYPTNTFRPDFYVYLVECREGDSRATVGMALFYEVYSTWKGRSIHLEDLFVQEDHRALGLGSLLMRLVGAVVCEMKMTRYQWVCLTWNEKPRQFYSSLGTSELNEWVSIRMEDKAIEKFVYFGRGEPPIASSSIPIPETVETPQNSTEPTSWNDRFAQARKVLYSALTLFDVAIDWE